VSPFFLKVFFVLERIHLLSSKANQFYTQIFTSPALIIFLFFLTSLGLKIKLIKAEFNFVKQEGGGEKEK